MKTQTSRVGINIPTELLKQIDAYADKMSINRTSACCVLMSEALDAKNAMISLSEAMDFMKANSIADKMAGESNR